MAKYVPSLIGTEEAQSPVISGLTQAVSTLANVLDLQTAVITDYPMQEVFIASDDRFRIYEVDIDKKGWLSSPPVVVKKNNVELNLAIENIIVDYLGGSIEFKSAKPVEGDLITVTASYIANYSNVLQNLTAAQEDLLETTAHFKGSFATLTALEDAVDAPVDGDFAIVLGTTNTMYIWNASQSKWFPVFVAPDLADYVLTSTFNTELRKKESSIAKHGETSTSDNYFYGGRKTWIDLFLKVRSATLTGLSTSTNNVITATDTMLTALGKLQAQITGNKTTTDSAITTLQNDKADKTLFLDKATYDSNNDGIVNSSENGMFQYTQTALSELTGNGSNGYFVAAFSGNIANVTIDEVGYSVSANGENSVDLVSGVTYWFTIIGNTINFKIGGGGSSSNANYEVVTSTTPPMFPSENTIWINTETPMPSNGWAFSAENPFLDNPVLGNVWLQTKDTATIELSTSKNIVEQQKIDTVYQYNGTSWISAATKIYQNGVWYDIYGDIRYLMSNRTEFEQWDITLISGIVGKLEFNESALPPEMFIQTQGNGTYSTNIKIDLTPYKTLRYEYLFPTGAGTLSAGIGTTAETPSPTIAHARSNSWQSKTIDVTNYIGEYYILFKLTNTASSPNFGLRDMTLTK